MKSSAKKIELASVDDLFSTEEGRQDAKLEKIQEIPLSELHPFKNHPFKVKDDEAMKMCIRDRCRAVHKPPFYQKPNKPALRDIQLFGGSPEIGAVL